MSGGQGSSSSIHFRLGSFRVGSCAINAQRPVNSRVLLLLVDVGICCLLPVLGTIMLERVFKIIVNVPRDLYNRYKRWEG